MVCQIEISQGYCNECEESNPFVMDEETRLALVEDMRLAMVDFDLMIEEITAERELEAQGIAPWQLRAKPYGYFEDEQFDELEDSYWGF
jgi:hypothetical protein